MLTMKKSRSSRLYRNMKGTETKEMEVYCLWATREAKLGRWLGFITSVSEAADTLNFLPDFTF